MVEGYIGGTGDEKTDIALAQLYEDRDRMGGSVPALYVLIARVEEKLDKLLKRTEPAQEVDPDSGIPYLRQDD